MGIMDKVKKILFDEEEVEVPVNDEKSALKTSMGTYFVDHSKEEEKESEDTIKEIKLPPYEENEEDIEDTKEVKKFNFPDNFVFDDNEVVGSRFKDNGYLDNEDKDIEKNNSLNDKVETRIDYTEVIKENHEERKPFKVSPTISPIFGIIDKDYVREEVNEPKNVTIPPKKRTFGPVSYNDDGVSNEIDTPKKKSEVIKEELKEVNTTINEMIDEKVESTEIDEIKTSGIENEYIGNTNIEDAFESTSEFNQIKENDESVQIEEYDENDEAISMDELKVNEDESLDDTIETDLFNLIDSMYSSDSTDDREDE